MVKKQAKKKAPQFAPPDDAHVNKGEYWLHVERRQVKLPANLQLRKEYCDALEQIQRQLFCNPEPITLPASPFPKGYSRNSPRNQSWMDWDRMVREVAAVVVDLTEERKKKAADAKAKAKKP